MNPFIPIEKARLLIVAGNANEETISSLEKLDLEIIPTIKCEGVYDSIAYHPDIVIHPINHNTLMVAPNVFDYYKDRLAKFDIKLIKGEKHLTRKYPYNIAYNVGRLDKLAIHNFKFTDEKLKYYLKKENIKFVNIKQGYSKCSLATIGNRSGITADIPIYNKLSNIGYNILLIRPEYIDLEGQNYGFIGGTSGNLSKDLVLFSGSLKDHPDKKKIMDFLSRTGKKPLFLSKKPISDIGSLISL